MTLIRIRVLRPVELYGRVYGTREQATVDERTAHDLIDRGVAERVVPINGADLGPALVRANMQTR